MDYCEQQSYNIKQGTIEKDIEAFTDRIQIASKHSGAT
jgi:hypothetical protein